MVGLRVFTSNRLEVLADKLSTLLSTPLSFPLTPEVIIVQSRGMERWLSMEIARRLGICANVRFPFPKTFVEEAFAAVLGETPATDAFSPDVMTWKLMKLFPSLMNRAGFEQIRGYLESGRSFGPISPSDGQLPDGPESLEFRGGAGGGLKRFQLAERIARLFDQYLIFRPEMMAAWERGGTAKADEIWQSELWRALIAGEEASHPAARKEAFLKGITVSGGANYALPERVSVFGISVLPRFHLEILHALSHLIEVNLFLMNPSREFWGTIRSEKEREREVNRIREVRGNYGLSPEGLHLEGGNRLLASLGTLGREFFSLIWDFAGEEGDFFADPGTGDLLSSLQSDILNLRDRGEGERKLLAPEDRSVRFHSCHSPMREIEALHDQLLSFFEENEDLLPRDILVMAPDIEVYAPLIKAVFDRPGGIRIPFTIADRGSRAESGLIEGFMMLLDMAGGRFGAGQVLAPLEIGEVAAKFGITTSDVELIRTWVAATGIRWGIDGENRRRMGLPAISENTWRDGLSRLLMGYAMPGMDGILVDGIVPFDVEGGATGLLGRLLDYTEELFSRITSLADLRTLGEWSLFLVGMMEGLFLPLGDDRERGMETLREAILGLRVLEEASWFKEPVDIDVIKSCLSNILTEKGFGFGFLAGGVTFCSMLPMRSIPFRVICLLGMNGADYPRRSWAPAFDLIAKYPRPCDRSRRKDDRYLFLEALLSARQRLIISYVGLSSEDNSILPPSVLVTELLDYLEEGFARPDGGTIQEYLVTTHRLQAFSPAYFQDDGGLFSYSEDNRRAAQCLREKNKAVPVPVSLLPLPDETWRHVSIADLVSFFADPVRFLFRRRLNADIAGTEVLPEEREPFSLGGLEKYALEQALVEMGIAGADLQGYRDFARASGKLPHGAVGVYSYQSLLKEVRGFAEQVKPFISGKEASARDIDLSMGGFRLSGNIRLYNGGLVHFRYADLKVKDYLNLWIAHLALAVLSGGASTPAVLLGKDGAWRFQNPSDPGEHIAALLNTYWEGLSKPLKFFPRSSWEYGRVVFGNGKPRQEGRQAAATIWRGNDFQDGEGANPCYHICFGDDEPLDDEFEETAKAVLQGIFNGREEVDNG
jgi:exodeoxyribonuclease V gamma subunit